MMATTANSTSIHFGMGHQCHKHQKLLTLNHIVEFDALVGCEKVRDYSKKLNEMRLLEWGKEGRLDAILTFAQLTV